MQELLLVRDRHERAELDEHLPTGRRHPLREGVPQFQGGVPGHQPDVSGAVLSGVQGQIFLLVKD